MANVLTNLVPTLFVAADTVGRECVGLALGVERSSEAAEAALNQQVTVPITSDAGASADNTPAVTPPDTGDVTTGTETITISKSKHQPVRWSGEDQRRAESGGYFQGWIQQRFEQAMRALVNEIETDLWTEMYQSASRAYGTPGTAPFGTANDLSDFANVLRILEENGAKGQDLQLALGHAAMANLRGKQSVLFKVNEAGSSDMLRNGMTDRVQQMALRHSNAIGIHTKGTGSGYLLNSASAAIGTTTIPADTGTGTILAGDIVTFAGTTDKYVVNTALSGGSFAIGKPGLRAAEADDDAITVGNNYTANLAFARSSTLLATRMPLMGNDMASDVERITDPVSGLTFEVAEYRQFGQTAYHVRMAWGYKVIKPNFIATLLG